MSASADNQFEFKAETQRVLSLVINSLYTRSEVFLRELISNASDALDKARFLQLTDKEAREQEGEPGIDIELDTDAKTLTVRDNGIGMTREEVIDNLGTIAHSGSGEFLEKYAELSKKGDHDVALELIGQFGVGFYAVFMVATRVDVQTLSMKTGEPVLWRSNGEGHFTVLEGDRKKPGTEIVVHLKEECAEYAEKWRLEAIIQKYSDFVMFPIRIDGEVANQSSALWRTPRSKVSDEQHQEFFKHLSGSRSGDKPLATIHYSVDAPVQFSALLYVPEKRTPDLFQMQKDSSFGPRLYAQRVMIMDHCESLLPSYMRFVIGVVDSEDLTLNVSRETLQENRTVKQIEQQLSKQVLKGLEDLAKEDADAYQTVWNEFGQIFKEGLSSDWKNKDRIAGLCRFGSLKSDEEKLISLDDYLEAKDEEQTSIYYMTGVSRAQVVSSAHLEVFRNKDIDVLLMCDPIDEWVAQSLPEYKGVKLKSVVHGELDDLASTDDEDAAEGDEGKEVLEAAAKAVKSALGNRVSEVRLSTRLTETASCLVSKEGNPGANFERIMKLLDKSSLEQKRILELNPKHAIVKNLAALVAKDTSEKRPLSSHVQLWSELLFDQALLGEGVVEDPATLVKRIQALLVESSNRVVGD